METFLVRLWVPSGADCAGSEDTLRGFVEHPRTEQRWRFAGGAGLLDRLTHGLSADPPMHDAGRPRPGEVQPRAEGSSKGGGSED